MTQLILKSDVDQHKIDILLSMIKSWDMEAEVYPLPVEYLTDSSKSASATCKSKRNGNSALTLSVGIWEGRDVNDKQLREKAWGTAKRI